MSSRTRAPDLVVSVAARLFLSVAVWPVLAVSVFPGPGQALLAFLVCGLPLAGAAVLLLAGRTRVPAIVFGAVNLAGWPVLLAWVERDVIATLTATVWWIAVLYTLAQDGCGTDEPRRPVPPRRGPRDAPVPVWVATGLGLVVAVAAGAYAASGLVTGGPNQAPAHAQLYSAMSLVALSALFAAAASVALLWAWRPARVLTLSGWALATAVAVLGTVRYGLAVEAPAATDLAPGIVLALLGGVLMIVVASGPVEELLDLQ